LAPSNPVPLRFEAFELDEANARLLHNGQVAPLAPKPFALLCELVRRHGDLCTKQALLDKVWGHQFVSDSVLKTAISDLRTVLGDDPRRPRFIETASRRGYRFVAQVAIATAASRSSTNATAVGSPSASVFVGRGSELTRLHRAWNLACSGKRSVVWVVGEPGIGKTALIEQFVASLGDVACARGHCVEYYGAGEPYLPVLEALAELCRIDNTVPNLLRAVAPAWLMQLPWLCTADERDALRRELAGVGPERMPREMGELLDRIADRGPLLLVTEDLHWSDRATLQLLDYLARRRGHARLMWLASFRLAEVVALDHPLNALRRELRLHSLCTEVMLDSFSEAEVAQCIATQSRSLAQDEAFVHAVHERTDGVPLFVTSIMHDVMSRPEAAVDASHVVASTVPDNVAIIDHYVARLGVDQRRLLTAAAVCGAEFRVTTIADVLGSDAALVEATCEGFARERLWLAAPQPDTNSGRLGRSYAFSHALFRHVLYEGTPPVARARLHSAVAEELERERAAGVPVTAAELAMHFERSQDSLRSLDYYVEAADAALLHLSPAECISLTERALVSLESARSRPAYATTELTLWALRGVASFQLSGVTDDTRDAFQNAYFLLDRVPDHRMRGLLLHGLGYVHCLRTEFDQALAIAERAATFAASSDDTMIRLAAYTVQGQVSMLRGQPRAAHSWLVRGTSLLEASEETEVRSFAADPAVTISAMLGLQLLHLGLVQQGRARLLEAHARAERLGQPTARMVALWYETLFDLRLGDVPRVAALAEEMRVLADAFSLAHARSASRWFGGWAQARMGAPTEGYRLIREAHEANVALGMMAGASENLGYAAEALLLSGDLPAAQRQLEDAAALAHRSGELVYQPQLSMIEAAIAEARGDDAAAEASRRRAVAEARAQGAPWLELVALLALCESTHSTDADRIALATLVEQLPEASDTAAVNRARALLGRADHA
jgi:DNA-binding winged helix-turn-helix (wHTH) protein